MQTIDGKKLQKDILTKLKNEIAKLSFVPIFCDILVGNDPSSVQYVEMKAKTAESIGIKFHRAEFPVTITTDELVNEIQVLNKVGHMCGIIVQLPLPEHLDRQTILDAIDARLDVDCLGTINSALFYKHEEGALSFPTARACTSLLDSLNIDISDKNVVVLGQGPLVGRPVAAVLHSLGIEPVVIINDTPNKEALIKAADVIISGIGKPGYLKGEMIKQGVIIIDAGTSELNGGIVGDVDFGSVKNVAEYISPVPGGVGPVTVAMLFQNVFCVAEKLESQRSPI